MVMSTGKAALCCAIILLLTSVSIAQGVSTIATRSLSEEAGVSFASDDSTCKVGCETCGRGVFADACCRPEPRFFVTAESLFLKLDRGTRNAVPVVLNEDTRQTVLTTHDLDYSMVAGPRLAFGYWLNECAAVEVSYFGLHHWEDSDTAVGDNNLRLPGDLALATQDFFDADRMQLDYTSSLHNAEVNYYRRTRCENLSLLVGFRYLSLDETFNIHANDIDAGGSDYNIGVNNRLYGAQLGGRWQKEWNRFGLDFVGKAGIFGNASKQHTFVGDFDNTFVMRDSTTTGSHVAFVGELGINGTYKLTKTLYARAGYNLLWVEGLARAMDQLDFTDTPDSGMALVFGKGAFLHGATVGLEARW
jgi:hypothetical protein